MKVALSLLFTFFFRSHVLLTLPIPLTSFTLLAFSRHPFSPILTSGFKHGQSIPAPAPQVGELRQVRQASTVHNRKISVLCVAIPFTAATVLQQNLISPHGITDLIFANQCICSTF